MRRRRWLLLSLLLNLVALGAAAWSVHRLGGWRFTAHRLHTLAPWPTVTQRVSQLELLPISPGSVVFLGDSHVAQGEWGEWLGGGGIANRGVPGIGAAGLAAFAKTLPLHLSDTIVVQVGTNDLLFHDAQGAAEMYRDLIGVLLAVSEEGKRPRIVLVSLPGVNNEVRWTGIEPEEVKRLNARIGDLAIDHNLTFMDLAAALGSVDGVLPAGLTDDGVHLRGDGYQKWVTGLRPLLRRGTTFAQ